MSFDIKDIRNVVLLGYFGSGKMIFVEMMIFEVKEILRRGIVEDGNIVLDYMNIEKECGNFIFSILFYVKWKDLKINILDMFGFDDFVGEIVFFFKVVDIGVMLLNVKSGVEVGIELIWEYVEKYKMFVFFVIN